MDEVYGAGLKGRIISVYRSERPIGQDEMPPLIDHIVQLDMPQAITLLSVFVRYAFDRARDRNAIYLNVCWEFNNDTLNGDDREDLYESFAHELEGKLTELGII
ncbi:MAG: hypothetical protein OXG78_07065 [Chloroflexi bacterium]|nr:hypothetical protein [Chloroflexota bacterium]